MNQRERALGADIAGYIIEAAGRYEEVILKQDEPAMMLHLAVLYWRSTDPAFIEQFLLPQAFVKQASIRCLEVIASGKKAFPEIAEFEFWERYFPFVDWNEAFPEEDCRAILAKAGASLAPYIMLHRSGAFQEEVARLKTACLAAPTTKNRYLLNALAGANIKPAQASAILVG